FWTDLTPDERNAVRQSHIQSIVKYFGEFSCFNNVAIEILIVARENRSRCDPYGVFDTLPSMVKITVVKAEIESIVLGNTLHCGSGGQQADNAFRQICGSNNIPVTHMEIVSLLREVIYRASIVDIFTGPGTNVVSVNSEGRMEMNEFYTYNRRHEYTFSNRGFIRAKTARVEFPIPTNFVKPSY
ncbi:hypothetical protein GIB67_005235, partial [Kingdonia uniflora]